MDNEETTIGEETQPTEELVVAKGAKGRKKNDTFKPSETKPASSEEMISVPKSMLENIVNTMNELKTNQKQYEQTASQDQIKKIEALRASGKLVKSIKISLFNNKLVRAWESLMDEVYIDHVLGKEVARQMTKITFFDGESMELSQTDFARRKLFKEFEVIKEGKTNEGNIELTVMTADGEQLVIDSRYIN